MTKNNKKNKGRAEKNEWKNRNSPTLVVLWWIDHIILKCKTYVFFFLLHLCASPIQHQLPTKKANRKGSEKSPSIWYVHTRERAAAVPHRAWPCFAPHYVALLVPRRARREQWYHRTATLGAALALASYGWTDGCNFYFLILDGNCFFLYKGPRLDGLLFVCVFCYHLAQTVERSRGNKKTRKKIRKINEQGGSSFGTVCMYVKK